MRDFVTCLEFLTRLRFSRRTDWRDDDFSRSVPYFPLVGLVMGLFMGAVNYGLYYLHTPDLMRAVMLVLAELLIIGALMYDGFMDTSDGVFSARDRERMLEIMKDSHVGSNAGVHRAFKGGRLYDAGTGKTVLRAGGYVCLHPHLYGQLYY